MGNDKQLNKKKVYNSKRWINLRLQILNRNPICYVCNKVASTEVDHIKTFKDINDPLAYDNDNLRGICFDCHREISYYENIIQKKLKDRPLLFLYILKKMYFNRLRRPFFNKDGFPIFS